MDNWCFDTTRWSLAARRWSLAVSLFGCSHHRSSRIGVKTAPLNNGGPVHVRDVAGAIAVSARTYMRRTGHVVSTNNRCIHLAARNIHRTRGLGGVGVKLHSRKCSAPLITSMRFGPGMTSMTTRCTRGMHVGPKGCMSPKHAFQGLRCASRRCTRRVRGVHTHFVPFLGVYGRGRATVHVKMGRNSLSSHVVSRCNSAPRNVIRSYVRFLHVYITRRFGSIIVSVGTSGAIMVIEAIHLLMGRVRGRNVTFPLRLKIARTKSNRSKEVGSTLKVNTLLTSNLKSAVHISLDRTPRGRVPMTHGLISCVLAQRKRPFVPKGRTPRFGCLSPKHQGAGTIQGVKKSGLPMMVTRHLRKSFRAGPRFGPSCVCYNKDIPRSQSGGVTCLMSTGT